MVVIPFDSTQDAFTQDVDFDGVTYSLSLWWNFRDEAWYLDFADSAGVTLRTGIKVVLGIDLLNGHASLPAGNLLAVPTDPAQVEIAKEDMGNKVSLIYATPADVAAAAA